MSKLSKTLSRVVKPVIDKCQEHAGSVKHIFENVIPDDDGSWLERYRKALQTLKPGRKH